MRYAVTLALLAVVLGIGAQTPAPPKEIELRFTALKIERPGKLQQFFSFYDFGRAVFAERKSAKGELVGFHLSSERERVTGKYSLQVWFQDAGGLAIAGRFELPDGDEMIQVGINGRMPNEGTPRVIGRKRLGTGTSYLVQASYR